MQIINAIIMGIIQGLTEFLPISSSAHLVLYQHLFGKNTPGVSDITLEIFLHLGSLFAVIIFFRSEIWELCGSFFHWKTSLEASRHIRNRMVVVYLFIATVFTGIVYLFFGHQIKSLFDRPMIVAGLLGITGCILFFSDHIKKTEIPMSGMGVLRSVLIGIGQGIGMLPGVSRSGVTISTSLYCGVKRTDAARFSFLLSIPAILAANLSEFETIIHLQKNMLISYLAGAFAAFISGFLVISLLIRFIQKSRLKYFAIYCWFISLFYITYMFIR